MDAGLLPPQVLRWIGDASNDKRTTAALEVEQLFKALAAAGDEPRILLTLRTLVDEFAFSQQENHRKGALLCLAAAAVGIGRPNAAQLHEVVPVVLVKMTDQDTDVRYHAAEALYNIAKVAQGGFIAYFNEAFDAMFRLCADSNARVRNAMQFLDTLVKDVVTAHPEMFNIAAFVPKVRLYLDVAQPHKRRFLISWISVLDSMPDIDIIGYLPMLLDGLMGMLSDPNKDIQQAASKVIKDFLSEVEARAFGDFHSLSRVLLASAQSQDDLTRLTALTWLRVFVELYRGMLLLQYPSLLGVALANICHANTDIQQAAARINASLLSAPPNAANGCWVLADLDLNILLTTIGQELSSDVNPEPARMEAVRWAGLLLQRSQQQVLPHLDTTLVPALLDCLGTSSAPLMAAALKVVADVAGCPNQFRPLLKALLERFRSEDGARMLHRGGSLVLRRLCAHLGAERVFVELSLLIDEDEDTTFASSLLQALNVLLLTASELQPLRDLLHFHRQRKCREGATLFATLYACWSCSLCALLSLCFLGQAYDQAHAILDCMCTSGIPLTADQLVHIDGLVALLETPCFAFVRLALLGQPPGLPPDGGVDRGVGGVGHEAAVAAGTGAIAGAGLRSAAAMGATPLAEQPDRGCDVIGTSPSPYQAMAATYAAAVAGSAEVAAAAAAARAGKGKSQAVHTLTQQGGGDSLQAHSFSADSCGTAMTGGRYEPPPHELVAAMQCLLVLLPQGGAWRTLQARMQSIPFDSLHHLDALLSQGVVGAAWAGIHSDFGALALGAADSHVFLSGAGPWEAAWGSDPAYAAMTIAAAGGKGGGFLGGAAGPITATGSCFETGRAGGEAAWCGGVDGGKVNGGTSGNGELPPYAPLLPVFVERQRRHAATVAAAAAAAKKEGSMGGGC